ncbi:MAG: hypothetical protein ACPGYV_09610, partial [Phycisphaeraceae bacterium]
MRLFYDGSQNDRSPLSKDDHCPMITATTTAYDRLIEHTKEANLLGSTGSLLGWDQETLMPSKGLAHRTRQ